MCCCSTDCTEALEPDVWLRLATAAACCQQQDTSLSALQKLAMQATLPGVDTAQIPEQLHVPSRQAPAQILSQVLQIWLHAVGRLPQTTAADKLEAVLGSLCANADDGCSGKGWMLPLVARIIVENGGELILSSVSGRLMCCKYCTKSKPLYAQAGDGQVKKSGNMWSTICQI